MPSGGPPTEPPASAPCALCGQVHSALEACASAAAAASSGTALMHQPSAAPQDELIGTTLGNFRIVRQLGKGGMGSVYLGEHTIIGSKVAVKFLHPHLAGEQTLVERFFAEARAANLIGHENIVSIFDLSYLPPNRYYLVMEFLDGQPLSTLVGTPMPAEVAVPILCQACDALQAAHAAGVIHRDLKPENVFLVRRGSTEHFVKLVDFGIAKLTARTAEGLTAAGLVVGTPEYMAPEQWMGEEIDGRADLYALGIIAYALATGRLPFRESTPLAYYAAHRDKQPAPPSKFNPSLPPAYEEVILRALAKRPEDRFQVAFEMREALRQALTPASAPAPLPRQPTPAAVPPAPPPVSAASKAPPARQPTQPPLSEPAAPVVVETPPASDSSPLEGTLQAVVAFPGQPERRLDTADLSRAGLFLPCAPPLPALFTRAKLRLLHPQRTLEVDADVVRHVDAEQARAWNLPGSGFAVQFVSPTPAFREAVVRLMEKRPLDAGPSVADAAAAAVLEAYSKRLNGDHYSLLGTTPDSECTDVRGRGRQALAELDALKQRPLSEKQREQLASLREKVEAAATQLATPGKRAEYDANRGNFRGVARCLSAGLTLTELQALRTQYLSSRPRNETNARLKAVSANALLNAGQEGQALEAYEAALALDPLSLEIQQSYWALKRRVSRSRTEAPR